MGRRPTEDLRRAELYQQRDQAEGSAQSESIEDFTGD
jgi:hypothetical protein